MQYTKNNEGIITEKGYVPCDPLLGDYRKLMARIISGELPEPDPYVPPPEPTPAERRKAKYIARVDEWTHAIARYQARLLDARLSVQKKATIQAKLDAAILRVQDESTAIETEDPDQ